MTRRKPGTIEITGEIRKRILPDVANHGGKLPAERHLANRFRVARGTIRSALSRLSDEGLIEIKPGSGAYVVDLKEKTPDTPIGASSPLELMDVRFGLEPHICKLAVIHGRRSDFDELDDIACVMEDSAPDQSAFSAADTAFHHRLVATTRNELMIWIFGQLETVRAQEDWVQMTRLTLDEKTIAEYNIQHRQILTALRDRDPEEASKVMKMHLDTARLSLTRAAET